MGKYKIVNKQINQVVCKNNNGRHYRQMQGYITKGLKPIETTKDRAEKECEYLNTEYYKGWEIEESKE